MISPELQDYYSPKSNLMHVKIENILGVFLNETLLKEEERVARIVVYALEKLQASGIDFDDNGAREKIGKLIKNLIKAKGRKQDWDRRIAKVDDAEKSEKEIGRELAMEVNYQLRPKKKNFLN